MSKMSRHVFDLIQEGTLPQEIEGFDYDNRDTEEHTRSNPQETPAVSISGHGGRGFFSERGQLGGQEPRTDSENHHLAAPKCNGRQAVLGSEGLENAGDAGVQSGVTHEGH